MMCSSRLGAVDHGGAAVQNAILIVEFAKENHDAGMDLIEGHGNGRETTPAVPSS